MTIRVEHALGRDEALRRILSLAGRLGVRVTAPDGDGTGTLEKETPLGAARASWRVRDDAVELEIEAKPPFVPRATVERVVSEELRKALA